MKRFSVVLGLSLVVGCSASSPGPMATTAPSGIAHAQRTPHPATRPGEVLVIGIKELGNFDYDQEKGGNIPADVKRLSGVTVRLTGYMVPSGQENITEFALVPELYDIDGGGPGHSQHPPQIQQVVLVECPKGMEVAYFPDPIVVEGKLTVEEMKDDGYIVGVFQVTATSVMPASRK